MTATSRKTSAARLAVILTVTLLVSCGLCGANFVLFDHFGTIDGGGQSSLGRPAWASGLLLVTGLVELVAIAISAIGLVVVGISAIAGVLLKTRDKEPE